MLSQLKPAILITLVFTVLTGIIYPLAVTGVAQAVFPHQANGSLIEADGKVIGSELIGQNFSKPGYFHPRPSAAGASGYDGGASSGSNLGPNNPALADRLKAGAAQFRAENPEFTGAIPSDAITTSASGLDPAISPANALAQVARVAKTRNIAVARVTDLVNNATQPRALGVIGEPAVNVLQLNLMLDKDSPLRQ